MRRTAAAADRPAAVVLRPAQVELEVQRGIDRLTLQRQAAMWSMAPAGVLGAASAGKALLAHVDEHGHADC
jgi:hypothetical protein